MFAIPPQDFGVVGVGAHSPVLATDTEFEAATQAVAYVFPSQPQTGLYSSVQTSGMAVQMPVWSAAPHWAATGKLQNWPLAQVFPARPPQLTGPGVGSEQAFRQPHVPSLR